MGSLKTINTEWGSWGSSFYMRHNKGTRNKQWKSKVNIVHFRESMLSHGIYLSYDKGLRYRRARRSLRIPWRLLAATTSVFARFDQTWLQLYTPRHGQGQWKVIWYYIIDLNILTISIIPLDMLHPALTSKMMQSTFNFSSKRFSAKINWLWSVYSWL